MNEQEQRAAVGVEALTWQGTPFSYGRCLKGPRGGVDCGRYPAACLKETGVIDCDLRNLPRLPRNWFAHCADNADLFGAIIKQFAVEYQLSRDRRPQTGDIVIARYYHDWAHAALVLAWPRVIAAAWHGTVTVWENIYASPQYGTAPLRFFDPWAKRP